MKIKLSQDEVSQTFNLKKLLGYDPSEDQKELFYALAVDKMVQRTVEGKDINGKKMGSYAPYSPDYAKLKGVSRSSVDMVLNGDMLDSFEDSNEGKGILKISIKDGVETEKAYNHNVGDTLPKRPWFGFKSEKDIKDILIEVDDLKDDTEKESGSRVKSAFGDLAELRAAINKLTLEVDNGEGDS